MNVQRSLLLQYHDWGVLEQGTEPPTAPRAPQHKWLPTAPGVCSRCVCVFTVCVCVHCCVCVHFGWVKCRAQIPSMGHHTWSYVTSLTGLNLAQVFKRFLAQHTLIDSTIYCQLSLEYNEPIRTQFRSDSLQILHLKLKKILCINRLCNKICFRSLCCPLSVQNYHKLKRIHANIVQNHTFLGRFQTFGGQCMCIYVCIYIYIYIYRKLKLF